MPKHMAFVLLPSCLVGQFDMYIFSQVITSLFMIRAEHISFGDHSFQAIHGLSQPKVKFWAFGGCIEESPTSGVSRAQWNKQNVQHMAERLQSDRNIIKVRSANVSPLNWTKLLDEAHSRLSCRDHTQNHTLTPITVWGKISQAFLMLSRWFGKCHQLARVIGWSNCVELTFDNPNWGSYMIGKHSYADWLIWVNNVINYWRWSLLHFSIAMKSCPAPPRHLSLCH